MNISLNILLGKRKCNEENVNMRILLLCSPLNAKTMLIPHSFPHWKNKILTIMEGTDNVHEENFYYNAVATAIRSITPFRTFSL